MYVVVTQHYIQSEFFGIETGIMMNYIKSTATETVQTLKSYKLKWSEHFSSTGEDKTPFTVMMGQLYRKRPVDLSRDKWGVGYRSRSEGFLVQVFTGGGEIR